MHDFYDSFKIRRNRPIQIEKKTIKRTRNTAAAFYADNLHSGQVTATKKITATVTSATASTPDNGHGHTPKTTGAQTLTAAKDEATVESGNEITLIEVDEEWTGREDEIENAGGDCKNVICKKKVALL